MTDHDNTADMGPEPRDYDPIRQITEEFELSHSDDIRRLSYGELVPEARDELLRELAGAAYKAGYQAAQAKHEKGDGIWVQ